MRSRRNVVYGLLLAAVVLVMWGAGEHRSLAGGGSSNGSPTPTPSPYPTPSIATVTSLCVAKNTDLVLYKWNFVSPYLLCYNRDAHTSGVGLWRETSSGFTHISGAGGVFDAKWLVHLGVPSNTATALVSGLHS